MDLFDVVQIRDETQTKIDLPAEGEKSDVIAITGKKENVEEARERIQKIQNELVSLLSILWHDFIFLAGKLPLSQRNLTNWVTI